MEMRLKVKKCAQGPASSRWSRCTARNPVSPCTDTSTGASRKAKLVALKGERTVLLKVLESLKSISKASSGLCLLNQRARPCAPGSAMPRKVLHPRASLATGHGHNSGGDEDGNGHGEVRGPRASAESAALQGRTEWNLIL
ncbi:hypothetical protein Cadr_000004042 [Camelus dromedarius]|uniref:Uncharacterized protein n=1 Tax=Camelus dromedarius TaxID=9838 RepID=A0A5N4EC15_CAMDR|nr:hypothetical protein Cadr_000004042 [Camelus dromedarius]